MTIATIGTGRDVLDLTQPLAALPLVFLDMETTGLDPRKGAWITEIAVLDWKTVRIDATMSRREEFAAHIPALRHILHSCIVVGHNVTFDLRHLSVAFERAGEHFPDRILVVDTLAIARAASSSTASLTLGAVAARLGIDTTGLHTARRDAEICRAVLREGPASSAVTAGARYVSVHGRASLRAAQE